jgi:Protein of unknown function (DUF1194)
MPTTRTFPALMTALLPVIAGPALAQDCRLALVLALDVSGSVDPSEDRLQREGLAAALLAPKVVSAFFAGAPVALHVFDWAGERAQAALLPDWRLIQNEQDLAMVADAIARTERTRFSFTEDGTALGTALLHAADVLLAAPPCDARTIDVAGDGANNVGLSPDVAYASPLLEGVTVNALVVGGAEDQSPALISQEDLVAWFEGEVLRGPAAFWVLADGYDDYERAMTVKLLRELELPLVSGWPASPEAG